MKISIKARNYIMEHGSVVTIYFHGIGGCCVPVYIAIAEPKEPDNPEAYKKFSLDGILIYYPDEAVIDEEVFQIDLFSSNSYLRLDVAGIDRGELIKVGEVGVKG